MRAAVDEAGLEPADERELWDYLVMAANSLVNAPAQAPRVTLPTLPPPQSLP